MVLMVDAIDHHIDGKGGRETGCVREGKGIPRYGVFPGSQ